MAEAIVSFEGNIIKVIYVTYKGKKPVVRDALTLRNEQFDELLSKERTREFIVVNSFKDFFQDTILIPPAKKIYTRRLIESEIRKRSTLKDFSFFYTSTGEKVVDNKRMMEIFAFAVNNDEIKSIINRFIQRGKVIKAIYPDVFSIASQIGSTDPVLCVSETGSNKNLFLVKDGKIQFIRTAQSLERGISDLDIQNINMTVNYCRQSLRISPAVVMLTGSLCSNYNATAPPSIPLTCLMPKSPLYLDFVSPLSAIPGTNLKDIDLSTRDYKTYYYYKKFLGYSTSLFLSLSILCIAYAGYTIKNIIDTRSKLDFIRKNLFDIRTALSSYDSKIADLTGYMPFIASLKSASSVPDIQRLLSLLSEIKTDNIEINSITITSGDNLLKVELKGLIRSVSFGDMQRYYQRMIDTISLKGFSIRGQRLELKDKSFSIDMEYR